MTMNKLGQWLLKRCLSREIRDAVLGDIDEITAVVTHEANSGRAKVWFWRQLLRSWPFLLAEKLRRKWSRLQSGMTGFGRGSGTNAACSILPIAGLTIGLACCLTILAITRDLRTGADAVDRGEGEHFAAVIPARFSLPNTGMRDTPVNSENIQILHARRLFTYEFAIMLAAGLVFMNSITKYSRSRPRRAGFPLWIGRSMGFVAAVFLLARLLTHLLMPYFRFLLEKQMLLYWLIALWLLVGGVSNIVPALALSLSPAVSPHPKKHAAVYLAFMTAFMIGTVLIFRQLDHLKDAQTARDQVRTSAILLFNAGGGLESRLVR